MLFSFSPIGEVGRFEKRVMKTSANFLALFLLSLYLPLSPFSSLLLPRLKQASVRQDPAVQSTLSPLFGLQRAERERGHECCPRQERKRFVCLF